MNKLIGKTYFIKRYFFIKFFLILLFVFCLNLFLRKMAPVSYASLPDYSQLYFDRDKTHIERLSIVQDSLEIYFAGDLGSHSKNNFRVFSDGKLVLERQTNQKKIRFKPTQQGITRIVVFINGRSDSVSMNIDYEARPPGSSEDAERRPAYEVTSDALISTGHLYAFREWAQHSWGPDSMGLDGEVQRLLKDSIRIQVGDNSRQKIIKIARFILERTAGKEGIPTDALTRLHPLKQLRAVQAGQSKLWCGNFSSIFSFMATSAGLPVRLVSSGLSDGHYTSGIHVFCEVYLTENRSWVYVDLTSRNILVRYGQQWLNVVDLHRLLRYPVSDSGFVALHYEKDSLYEIPFSKVSSLANYYFHNNAVFIFYYGDFLQKMHPSNWLTRGIKFLYTRPYYAQYSDNLPSRNYLFNLRVMSGYLLVLLLLLLGIALVKGWYRSQ